MAFEEFQDEPLPIRSEWPTCAEPVELLFACGGPGADAVTRVDGGLADLARLLQGGDSLARSDLALERARQR